MMTRTGTMWSEAKASTGEHCQPHSFGGALLCAGRAGPKSPGNQTYGMQMNAVGYAKIVYN